MSKWISVLAVTVVMTIGAAGCHNKNTDADMDNSSQPKKMSASPKASGEKCTSCDASKAAK